MIFFVGNDGTVTNSVPSPVYQGSAGANDIYLIAPFAVNLQVTVAFKLPNGVWTERYLMTQIAEIKGAINEKTGKPYIGWRFSLPNEITQYYGTVTVQFFFYTGNSGIITATSAASFTVGRGVPEVLPDKPTDDIYNQIIDNLSVLSGQIENGAFAARAIYAWNSTYKYGANEITFYPEKGKFGAFIKSLIDNNLQPPYSEDGTLNNNWEEVVSFDHIADGYFTELKNLVATAASSEANAQASAEAAAGSTEEATRQAENAASSATAAMNAQTVATEQATAAANSAAQASVSEQNAANSATGAESAKQAAQASATEAHGWADVAKQWADYGIKINTEYTSLEELPDPGDSRFIYLIPNGGTGENSYDEYIWADSKSAYEKIGTTEIDLTAYATKNEVNAGLQGKLDKTDGVAENLSVKNNLTALTIDTEHINGRAGEPLIEQHPRMYAIAFGNMNNEMRLYGKAERPVYTANKVDADGELTTAEEEVAFVSDVDQKVNKSGDTMTGGLTVPALNVDSGNGDGLYIELGRKGTTGLEFHCQQNSAVYRDFDATIRARDANSTASNGSGVLNYVAREHSFEGSIVAPGTHNFIERGNEFNFANGYSGNEIWLNYRNASIGQYVFGNGAGGAANVIAGEVYDNDARVYSPNNKQPIITQSYLGGNPTTQKNCHGYLVFDSGDNGTGEIMICFGMFTSTTAEISFAKPFYGTPFVMTSPNHSTDMQTQRVAVKTTTNTGFTTESSGSYSGRYIAIGYR